MTTPDNKYAAMSRDYMERAERYLRQGDMTQASEKSWGAAAYALKAIAERRGWRHQSYSLLFDLSSQVADELARPDLRSLIDAALSMHQNFYDNWLLEDAVEHRVGRVKEYLAELESVADQLPPSFQFETYAQRSRLARLTGRWNHCDKLYRLTETGLGQHRKR